MLFKHPRWRALHGLFHRLWSRAVRTADYDKRAWQSLQDQIETVAREGLGAPDEERDPDNVITQKILFPVPPAKQAKDD